MLEGQVRRRPGIWGSVELWVLRASPRPAVPLELLRRETASHLASLSVLVLDSMFSVTATQWTHTNSVVQGWCVYKRGLGIPEDLEFSAPAALIR